MYRRYFFWFLLVVFFTKPSFAQDDSRYAAIDRHALAAPASATKSIKALSAYLIRPCTSDEEKARAIFRWIADNISYDVEGFFAGKESSSSSGDVLQSRSSVCAGYSSLFEELGKAAGLQVATIDGYAKGFGYHPGDRIPEESNHAWNAVKLRGEWRLIDCTWGAGKVEENHSYRKDFEPYYFLTKPEEFIYRHFPTEKRWQLLPRTVTQLEFFNFPLAAPPFFECGFMMKNDQPAILESAAECLLEFSTASDVICTADLSQKGKKCEAATLVQRKGPLYQVRIIPPGSGEYTLNVYAKKGAGDGMFPLAVSYRVITRSFAAASSAFPISYRLFVERNVQLHSPQGKDLPSGSSQTFSLTVPGAEKVSVVCGEEWDYLKKSGSQFEGNVEIGAGKVNVYALYPGDKTYQQLLEFAGTGSITRAPGPVKFKQFMETEAEIVGPVKKILLAGSEQFFRIKMPGAHKAAVVAGGHWQFLEKIGDYFEGTVKIGEGKNVVMGAYTSTTRFEGLLEYEGR